jgi:ubiquinone/menaquinone biosynthesis C-methylase UbiE
MTTDTRREPPARGEGRAPRTFGHILHFARGYDLLAWLLLGGRERAFRRKILDLARLSPRDTVLDVGCGTGTLAILAKEQLGGDGVVCGIDASPEMIERAQRKAKRAGIDVAFETACVEALPFEDGTFDVVLSTLMLHHLPREVRESCAREARRVTKPGGRVVIVDFGESERETRSIIERLHRHGRVLPAEIVRVLTAAGLPIEETGSLGLHGLHFVVARAP